MYDEENGSQSSASWGGMVTQGGVQKPVFEAIVEMMKVENIKQNLRWLCTCVHVYAYVCMCVCVYV